MRWSVRFLAFAQAVFVLAACSAAAGTSTAPASILPAPIDSPPPNPSPEPSPSEAAAPTEPVVDSVPIPPDTYARVVTDDLRVRSQPGVSDGSTKLEPLLQDGARVVVLDGPVPASGYDWYLVQPTITSDTADPYPFGWVAAADHDGEPWIEPETVECPPLPTSVEQLGEMNQVDALFFEVTCFGGKDITFEARLRLPHDDICSDKPWGVDPVWLDICVGDAPIFVPVKASPDGLSIVALWSPDFDLSTIPDQRVPQADWPTLEVTGMFDHPAAETCRNRHNYAEPGATPPDPAMTILRCRMQFVVTSMREVEG